MIDEADRMLDMGFIPDVERIVSLLPQPRQTLMFSATMPPEIRRLADAFLRNPVEIAVAPPASPAATVVQSLTVVDAHDKREALRRLLRSEDVKNALIFCNRKRDVDILYNSLARHGFDAAALHGDMAQPKRTETLERFRRGEIRLLVASDVAARGLDIKGMSHVFCFDVPLHAEDYVHRIGRTGRAGQSGRSFMLAAPEDGRAVAAIVKLIGREIPPAAIDGIAAGDLVYDEADRRRSRRSPRAGGPPRNGHVDAARAKLPAARHAVGPLVRAAPAKYGTNLTRAAAAAAARPLRPLERVPSEDTFLENHDNPRFAGLTSDPSLRKNAIAFTILADGIPIIYEGQEQGYTGGADPANREAVWLSGYSTTSTLYTFIAAVNQIRNQAIYKSNNYLSYMAYPIYYDSSTIAMRKGYNGNQIIGVFSNLGASGASYTLTLGNTGYVAGESVVEILSCTTVTIDSNGNIAVAMGGGLPKVSQATEIL